MPGIEPGASYMQSMRSTTELHPLLYIIHIYLDCFLALDGENQHTNSVSVCRLSVRTLCVGVLYPCSV